MTRDLLKTGERYLMRVGSRQVPVVYDGVTPANSLEFHSVKGGTVFFRSKAGAFSKHYDSCVLLRREACNCAQRLEEEK